MLRSIGFFLLALSTVGGSTLHSQQISAQERPGCFFATGSGEYVDLNDNVVCPIPTLEAESSDTATESIPPGLYQAQIVRRLGGIPIIQVVFNDSVPFEMMVDTGASNTVITPNMATALGVRPEGITRADTPTQRGVELQVGRVQSLNVGGAVVENLPVAISPALDVGLLGQDFFGQYEFTIKQDVVEFRQPSAPSAG
ncbi:MAG: TIGR02281 family clan AA aspartic protease [Microcoleaceae cyanobacterium]